MKLPKCEQEYLKQGLKRLGLSNLKEFWETEQWENLKRAKRELHLKCRACNTSEDMSGEKFHLHHLTYKDLGREMGFDVIWLCAECHEKVHKIVESLLIDKGIMTTAFQMLWQANEIENLEAKLYMEQHKNDA